MKRSKDSSARYYKKSKERLQKGLSKGIKTFLKKKRKSKIAVAYNKKAFLKMKNKGQSSKEKIWKNKLLHK